MRIDQDSPFYVENLLAERQILDDIQLRNETSITEYAFTPCYSDSNWEARNRVSVQLHRIAKYAKRFKFDVDKIVSAKGDLIWLRYKTRSVNVTYQHLFYLFVRFKIVSWGFAIIMTPTKHHAQLSVH